MESLVQTIFENSAKNPDKTALIVEKTALTYRELTDKIAVFAASLKAKKVKKGSRIIIETHNLLSFYCAFLGCHLAGCIAVPTEQDISIYKLHELLKAVKPVLIFWKDHGEKYEDYFTGTVPKRIVFPKEDNEATIVSTTGTTGNPALVSHTNKSMLAETQNLCEGTKITEDTVLFTNILAHMAAGYRRVFAALYSGATAVVTDKSVSLKMLGEYSKNYKINHLSLISTDIKILTEEASSDKTEKLDHIKYVESATSTLFYDTILKFHNMFPNIILFNVYGTTESGCLLINNTSENFKDGCIGKPTCNAEVFVVDENGERIETPGKYGYVAARGNMNMKCYYRKKALTDKVLQGDTIVLNDIVYFDEAGDYYFVSRVGDVINVKGQKIIPGEIEKEAMRFGGIKECACVAKDDEQQGQVPVLYIVCEDEASFDFDKLKEYLKENLESYRVPQSIIPIEKMPCTATGKIMRKHLSLMTK
ncbi:MAG: class I adenylate-forming enzyme family protein [Lachnospiraceae bacterium]